jgi:hypothetical protein
VLPSAPVPPIPRSWRHLLGAAVVPTVAPTFLLWPALTEPSARSWHSSDWGRAYMKRHIEVPNEHEGSLPNKSSRISRRAQNESNQMVRREYENLAKQFLHLAKEADRDATVKQVTSFD